MLGLKPNGLILVALGVAVVGFGLAGGSFHVRLPGFQSEHKMPLPIWFGRLWFLASGVLLIYLGITH
jgi:hypothetical protein